MVDHTITDTTSRETLVHAIVDHHRQASRAGSPAGSLVTGTWGVGGSWVLSQVAEQLRHTDVPVHHVVAEPTHRHLDDLWAGTPTESTVLVVDDAHRLDDSAAIELRDVALNAPLNVVLGARARPLRPAVDWLVSSGWLRHHDVAPFDRRATTALIEQRLGGPVQRGAVRRVLDLTGGRPAFVVDLVDDAIARGALRARRGLWRLHRPLRAARLHDRVERERRQLDPSVARAHRILGLAGRLPLHAAVAVIGSDAFDELSRLGYVASDRGTVWLDPPVTSLATVARLRSTDPDDARRLLERVGPDATASQRVRWRQLAGLPPADDDLERAAHELWAEGDHHAALELAEQAPHTPSVQRLHLALLEAIGRRRDAIDQLERFEHATEGPQRWRTASERATMMLWDLGESHEALDLSREVAQEAGAQGAHDVVLRHAQLVLFAGDQRTAAAIAGPLVDDPDVGHEASVVLAVASALEGDGTSSIARCEVAGATPRSDPEVPLDDLARVLALCEAGRLHAAERAARAGYERALAASSSHQAWMALASLRVALLTGDLVGARRFGLEAAEIFRDLDHHAGLRWATAGAIIAAASVADAESATKLSTALDEIGESAVRFLEPDVVRSRAWSHVATGDLPRARATLSTAAELAIDARQLSLAASASHDLVRLGGAEEAIAALQEITPRLDSEWAGPRLAHAEALIRGDVDGLLEVAAAFDGLGARVRAAEAAAQALTAARARDDRRAERRIVGIHRRLIAACPEARTPALVETPLAQLTARERQVAERAAAGRRSRDIAEELGISVRTVDNLLQRTYQKLGIEGRHELARLGSPPPT